jgi:hypothetical protein
MGHGMSGGSSGMSGGSPVSDEFDTPTSTLTSSATSTLTSSATSTLTSSATSTLTSSATSIISNISTILNDNLEDTNNTFATQDQQYDKKEYITMSYVVGGVFVLSVSSVILFLILRKKDKQEESIQLHYEEPRILTNESYYMEPIGENMEYNEVVTSGTLYDMATPNYDINADEFEDNGYYDNMV